MKERRDFVCWVCLLLTIVGMGFLPRAARSGAMALGRMGMERTQQRHTSDDNPWRAKLVTVERDPFLVIADADVLEKDAAAQPVGKKVVQGQPIVQLPTGTILRGIVIGARNAALVETGSRTYSAAVGDIFNGSQIVEIRSGGLLLADGRFVQIGGKH